MTSDELWDGLRRVRAVKFVTQGTSATGWSGGGGGSVTVESPSAAVLVFRESGIWRPAGGRDMNFHNVYRWSRRDDAVRLEHLRFGQEHPVYLFDLAPDRDGVWSSVAPHLCRKDEYAARLHREQDRILLTWTVAGPQKEERIAYEYALGQGV